MTSAAIVTLPDLPDFEHFDCELATAAASLMFLIEYAWRIWRAPILNPDLPQARRRYLLSFIGIVDLLCAAPLIGLFVPEIRDPLLIAQLLSLFKLSRLTPAQQVYFTDSHRLPRFYEALRGENTSPGPARPVFRPDPDLLLLVTRLELDATGHPMVPGNLQVWEPILRQKSDSKVVRQWAKQSGRWKDPDQLVEAMFAFSRQGSDDGPLKIYLMLSAIDSARPADRRLSPATVRLLGEKFARYGNQYLIFSEFHGLNDDSIDFTSRNFRQNANQFIAGSNGVALMQNPLFNPQLVATARSAIVTSSVSPERCDITAR